jgi:Mce-associated membrane protein
MTTPESDGAPRLLIARGVAAVIVAALLAVILLEAIAVGRHQHRGSLRRDAIRVASAQVVDLTTIDPTQVDDRIADLRKRTTGDFRRQLQGISQTFRSVVRSGKVETAGDVVAVAVTSVTDRRAHVLVANRTTVTNTSAKQPTTRAYRIRVDLLRVHDEWLVSGMEFVQ